MPNLEFYGFDQNKQVFEKISGNMPFLSSKEWEKAISNDPIRFTLTPDKPKVVLGEEIELTLTAELLDISPKLLFTFEELRSYAIKVVLPKDFIQTGGTYLNFAMGKLDPANPKQTYTIKGRYLDKPAPEDCFKVLRQLNEAVFILKNTTCINVTEVDVVTNIITNNYVEKGKFPVIDITKVRLSAYVADGTNQTDNDYFDGSNATSYLQCNNKKNLIQFALPFESVKAIEPVCN